MTDSKIVNQTTTKPVLDRVSLFRGTRKFDEIEIPDMGGVVYVAPLKTNYVLEYISAEPDQRTDIMKGMVARFIVDNTGAPIFSDEDVQKLHELEIEIWLAISKGIGSRISELVKSLGIKSETEAESGHSTESNPTIVVPNATS